MSGFPLSHYFGAPGEPTYTQTVVAFVPDVDVPGEWVALTMECPKCGAAHAWRADHVRGPLRSIRCGALSEFVVPEGVKWPEDWAVEAVETGVWGEFPEPPKSAPAPVVEEPHAPVYAPLRLVKSAPVRRRSRGLSVGFLDRWGE